MEMTLVLALITTNCLNTEQQNLVVGLNVYSLASYIANKINKKLKI